MAFLPRITTEQLLWAPFICACAHMFEEFAFPGGFIAWYRQYRGPNVTSITKPFLVFMNALLLFGCASAAITSRDPANFPLWLGITAILASNALWHLYAAWRTHQYSPGMITGTLLYLPLAALSLPTLFRHAGFPLWKALAAIAIGSLYTAWSAGYHRTRSHQPAQTQA